eukprot:365252-Chlamydomonas_euryale.AAC.21
MQVVGNNLSQWPATPALDGARWGWRSGLVWAWAGSLSPRLGFPAVNGERVGHDSTAEPDVACAAPPSSLLLLNRVVFLQHVARRYYLDAFIHDNHNAQTCGFAGMQRLCSWQALPAGLTTSWTWHPYLHGTGPHRYTVILSSYQSALDVL